MSTDQDCYIRPWNEVAALFNYRENTSLNPNTVKQIGLVALRKLKVIFEDDNTKLEDMIDL